MFFMGGDAVRQGSSVGESARLIIVRSRVQAPLLLQMETPGKSGVLSYRGRWLERPRGGLCRFCAGSAGESGRGTSRVTFS